MNSTRSAYSKVVAAYIAWGVLPIFWSLLSHIDPLSVLFQRTVWSALFLAGAIVVRGDLGRVVRDLISWRQLGITSLSTVCLGINWFSYVWAMKHKELFAASIAYYICPLLTLAGAAWMFRESFSRCQQVAVLFIAAGVALPPVLGGTFPFLAFIMASSWSAYTLTRRYYARPALEALLAETTMLALVLVALLPFAFDWGVLVPAQSSGMDLALFALSGFVTAAPIIFMIEGMKGVPMRAIGTLQYITPTLTLISSKVYFGINPTESQLLSLGLIWVGLGVFFAREGLVSLTNLAHLVCGKVGRGVL
jgi:chloramphenicol-sensitive protein RarD